MALSKPITTPYGVPASYHHVCAIVWGKDEPKARVQLASYPNAAARQTDGVVPLGRIDLLIPAGADVPTVEEAYAAIKTQPEWADATDC